MKEAPHAMSAASTHILVPQIHMPDLLGYNYFKACVLLALNRFSSMQGPSVAGLGSRNVPAAMSSLSIFFLIISAGDEDVLLPETRLGLSIIT